MRPSTIARWGAAVCVALGGSLLSAQTDTSYDEKLFGGLRWRSLGPARGGRSTAAAGSVARPLEYYFGTTGGGLWKTTNGGTTWTPVADKALKTSSVGAVAIAPSNPDIVYVGMGESQFRGNIIQGDGVYKTTDAGKTWTHMGLAKSMTVARIRVHPTNPDLVYVAALGHPYGPGPDRGVFRSRDGGKTWDRTLFRDEKTGAVDLAIDPKNPDVLYAALWEVFRTPHSLSSGGPGSGLFKSTDGGGTWTELTRKPGLPAGVIGRIGVSVSGADSERVYAIVEAAEGGVFASDDAGESWTRVSSDRRLRQRAFYYTRIYADPKEKDTVYVLNVGFHRSTDGGKTYRAIRVPHGDNHDLWIAPDDPRRMIEANDGGANVTVNGGESWTEQDYPTAQFYNVFTTNHVPYHVCGAQQDNSTACVPSTGGALYTVGGGESGYIAPHPKKLDVFFAGSYGGLITRFDRSTGQSKAINVWPENPMGHSAKDIRERFQWTFPIVISPLDPSVLYVSSQHLWRSRDEGQSWEKISQDLTRADPETLGPSGGPITLDQTGVETYATIFTVAPSRHDANVIWTGSDDGVAHVTRDGGKSWQKVTPPDLPAFTRISMIEVSPHKPATAYLVGNRYQRGDRAPYVYRTDDYGATWTKIVAGIPGDDFPRVIREDTVRPGLLFLGTEHGVYTSFSNGASWQSLRLELPVTPVHGIVVKDDDLVIGTHGRSFYVLDGIHVLRQLQPEMTTASVHLFAPVPATRRVQSTVPIDYYLKDAAEKVTIQILDASGREVRTFEGVAEKPDDKKDADKTGADKTGAEKAGAEKAGVEKVSAAKTDAEKKSEATAGEQKPAEPKPAEQKPGEPPVGEAKAAEAAGGKPGAKPASPAAAAASGGGEEDDDDGPPRPPRVTTKAGMNRLQWDMRHQGPRGFPGIIMWAAGAARGPIALPGSYQVKLTVVPATAAPTPTGAGGEASRGSDGTSTATTKGAGPAKAAATGTPAGGGGGAAAAAAGATATGAAAARATATAPAAGTATSAAAAPASAANAITRTQPIVVEKDPRTDVSDANLQAQFALAMQIRDKVTEANEAVLRIRHLKAQARERAEKAKQPKLTAASDALATTLTAIEGEIYQYRNQSNQDPLNYPIKLNNKIAALLGIVESADGRPTTQSVEVFKELSARLAVQIEKLNAAVKADLPPLNKLVASRRLPPIKDEVPPPVPDPPPTEPTRERLWN